MVTYYTFVYNGSEKFAANSLLGKTTVQPLLELLIKEICILGIEMPIENEKKQMGKMEIDCLNL